MEKINQNAAALAGGVTGAVLSLICLIFVAIFPIEAATAVANSLFHGISFSGMAAKSISFGKAATGLAVAFLIGAVIGYVFAVAYNKLSEKV